MTITCFYSIAGDILGATELRGPVNYKYKDLKSATKNFSEENKLGEGGFGDVYKVKLIEETRVKGKHFSSCYQIDRSSSIFTNINAFTILWFYG